MKHLTLIALMLPLTGCLDIPDDEIVDVQINPYVCTPDGFRVSPYDLYTYLTDEYGAVLTCVY